MPSKFRNATKRHKNYVKFSMIRCKLCLSKLIYNLKSLESKSFMKVALILGAACICTEKTKLLILENL